MTARHPKAAGSYGADFIAWANARPGLHVKQTGGLRWWQELVALRALEHDEAGALIWRLVIVTVPRQQGKSWLLRALCAWRMEQAERFGEVQTVVLTSSKLDTAAEIWMPATRWAVAAGHTVRVSNGQERITTKDGSRWAIQAANPMLGVGWSLSLAVLDEAWTIDRTVLDGAVMPTLSQSADPQVWLVSTSGDSRSDLMLSYRGKALEQLDDPSSTLVIEWSAPPDADPLDHEVWRAATPVYDERRVDELTRLSAIMLPDEFRSQYLNQWVESVKPLPGAPLVDPELWAGLRSPGLHVPSSGVVAALEASAGPWGSVAGVSCAWRLEDGRTAVVGRTLPSLTAGWAALGLLPPDTVTLVGLSFKDDPKALELGATGVGSRHTEQALPLVQDLVRDGRLVWDGDDLDEQARALRVVDAPASTGKAPIRSVVPTHVIRTAAWCAWKLDQAEPEPMVW